MDHAAIELDGSPAAPAQLLALGLVNYGHFTTMRVEGQRVRGLSLHLARLAHDCRTLFDADLDADRVRALIQRVAPTAGDAVIVRVTVFDPGLDIGHPGGAARPHVLVTTRPAPGPPTPLRLRSVPHSRPLPEVKHTGLFSTVHHRRLVQRGGHDDALFVTTEGHVTEGATWNIGFVDADRVVWPRADVLPGVTMRLLRAALDHAGPPQADEVVTPARVATMRCAFATNAAIGVRPIQSIDDVEFVTDLPVLRSLREAYLAVAQQRLAG